MTSQNQDWREFRRLRAWELAGVGWAQKDIAEALGVSPGAVSRWLARAHDQGVETLRSKRQSTNPAKLSPEQLLILPSLLRQGPEALGLDGKQWSYQRIADAIAKIFNIELPVQSIRLLLNEIGWRQRRRYNTAQPLTAPEPFFASEAVTLYQGDAAAIMAQLPAASVDCIVTSPPYYGQRDYEVDGQLGLEDHPQLFIDQLVTIFRQAKRVLKPSGSLWVNLGDTYWSGKGAAHGTDGKQKNRRFVRPQDKVGERPWCQPKQLLLIPHRFAMAMQEDGWIVRADNVWHKPWPTPDKRTRDRSVTAHEYVFHFVKQEEYYYNADAVALPANNGQHDTKALPSVWTISTVPSQKRHVAVFPPQLVSLPILATCPPGGVLLDPFCGSGTALQFAAEQGEGRRAIGIDLSKEALAETQFLLERDATPQYREMQMHFNNNKTALLAGELIAEVQFAIEERAQLVQSAD